MEQARIDSALENDKISNISVAQAATSPYKPASPRQGVNLALGFLAAIFGSVGLAFMAEGMDHSFSRLEDVEKRLKGPLLSSIPHVSVDASPIDSQKKHNPLLLPKVGTQCGIMSHFDEGCETLYDRLLDQGPGPNPPQVIAVTSSRAGEGVSTVASNLALAVARKRNQRVLLVEANSLHPSAHKIFGIKVAPGLTDVVAEGKGQITSVNSSRAPPT